MKSQFRILVLGDEVGLKPKGNITCVYECVCFCVCVCMGALEVLFAEPGLGTASRALQRALP